ncbi:MAG: hypothetical protein SGI74_11725 [Oligoflexia bacterium]|nr:hypothetical protein [Oligoflexia bacterium]
MENPIPEQQQKLKNLTVEELEKQANAASIAQRKIGPPDDGKPDKENSQIINATTHGNDLGILKDRPAGD